MKIFNHFLKNCSFWVLGVLTIISCKKEDQYTVNQIFDFNSQASLQLFNGIVGSNGNYLYADNVPLNGATITTNTLFPTSTASSVLIAAGNRNFLLKDTTSSTTQVPLSFSEQIAANKSYSILTYDTITQPKKILVGNNITIPADTTARLRLANLLYINTGSVAIDIVSKRRQLNIFTNVGYGEVTDFTPYPSNYNDTIYVIKTGTTDTIGTLSGNFAATAKTSYTAALRGSASSKTTTWGITSWPHRY